MSPWIGVPARFNDRRKPYVGAACSKSCLTGRGTSRSAGSTATRDTRPGWYGRRNQKRSLHRGRPSYGYILTADTAEDDEGDGDDPQPTGVKDLHGQAHEKKVDSEFEPPPIESVQLRLDGVVAGCSVRCHCRFPSWRSG